MDTTSLGQAGNELLEEDLLDEFGISFPVSPVLGEQGASNDAEYQTGYYFSEDVPGDSTVGLAPFYTSQFPPSVVVAEGPISTFFTLIRPLNSSSPWYTDIDSLDRDRPETLHQIAASLLYTPKFSSRQKTAYSYLRFADCIGEAFRFVSRTFGIGQYDEDYFVRLWFGGVLRYLAIDYDMKEESPAMRDSVERLRGEREDVNGWVRKLNGGQPNPYHRVWEWNRKALKYSTDSSATCPVCQEHHEKWNKACDLTVHIKRVHLPFGCSEAECGQRLGSTADLARHEAIHNQEATTYVCHYCDYSSKRKDNVDQHMAKRPMKCRRAMRQ